MQVNWFIVIAQVINFLILVWLLKRFLYKPILKAIADRENKIISELKEAEAQKEEAMREQAEFEQKNREFEQIRQDMIGQVVSETKEIRRKLMEETRTEAAELRTDLKKALKESEAVLTRDIMDKTRESVLSIVRKTLNDLAGTNLEEQSVNVFIKRLSTMSEEERVGFVEAFRTATGPILLHSAFDLSEIQQEEIIRVVSDILGAKPQFHFRIKPELISGIELSSDGYKLSWSVAEYIRSLQYNLLEALEAKTKSDEEPGNTE